MKDLPQKQTVNVDGQKIAYAVAGEGSPAIVFINGAGGPLEAWYKLFPAVTALGKVVIYDRPGVGGSAKPAAPQTGEAAVRLLRNLLREIGVAPPYLLVAHSFGGLHANLFARLHPDEIAGVLFLEATAPEDVGTMQEHQSGVQKFINGALNFFSKPDPNGEVANERQTVAQIAAAPRFPDVPVRVLSGGKTPPGWMSKPEAQAVRTRNQLALASLSRQGERLIAQDSGHFPQMSEPAVVIDAIAALVTATRASHA